MTNAHPPVAIVHDYLTQRGGAERVVLAMLKAFPGAPVYTVLYDPDRTFPEFSAADIRTGGLNRLGVFRRHHRLALPLLAVMFSRTHVVADVVLCSSSGWSQGAQVTGRRVVYCHSPARWLHQPDQYLGRFRPIASPMLGLLRGPLLRWDRTTARAPGRWLTNSSEVQGRIQALYGRRAEIVPPPYAVDPAGQQRPLAPLKPGFFLTVSRLLPYKNVDAAVSAFARLPDHHLVVVGTGPERKRLERLAGSNVSMVGAVDDQQLRWLYANSRAVLAASHEDYGLTPLEGAVFGKPAVVLRGGGFLDTVEEGVTGVFFDTPEPQAIAEAVLSLDSQPWDPAKLGEHAGRFSQQVFIDHLHRIVAEEKP